jgi:5-methylcytosine-specific restriction protein A
MIYAKPTYRQDYQSTNNRFYNDRKWKRFSSDYRRKNPLCENCSKANRVALAKVCDHIIAMKVGGAKFDVVNIQGLCRRCDQRKRRMERDGTMVIEFEINASGELIPRGEVQVF